MCRLVGVSAGRCVGLQCRFLGLFLPFALDRYSKIENCPAPNCLVRNYNCYRTRSMGATGQDNKKSLLLLGALMLTSLTTNYWQMSEKNYVWSKSLLICTSLFILYVILEISPWRRNRGLNTNQRNKRNRKNFWGFVELMLHTNISVYSSMHSCSCVH